MTSKAFVLILAFSSALPVYSQRPPQDGPPTAGVGCEDQSHALASGAYGLAVLEQVWPAAFPRSAGITIAVVFRPEISVLLHTDGTKFELWIGTANVPKNNVWNFLEDLAESCHLPPDPADAVKLLNIQWEAKELKPAQFEQLHKDFITALTDYVSTVRERSAHFMSKRSQGGGVDASIYPVVYDNSWEHLKIEEWDLPVNGKPSPIIKWVHELQSVAQLTFHRAIVGPGEF